jgi:Mn-dependent DtxR family transcriptional regulator
MEEKMTEQDIKRIREMMEFLVRQKISERIQKLSLQERKIYDLTGTKGQTEIVKTLKTAPNTVSNLWKKLESEGILIKESKGYRKVV